MTAAVSTWQPGDPMSLPSQHGHTSQPMIKLQPDDGGKRRMVWTANPKELGWNWDAVLGPINDIPQEPGPWSWLQPGEVRKP